MFPPQQIHFITLPRSGLHLLINVLKEIHQLMDMAFSFCEFYECCQTYPCKFGHTLLKNHDFALCDTIESHFKPDIPIIPEQKYIVLYRDDPIRQMEAWYRFFHRDDYSVSDVVEFYKKNIHYYNAFMDKWVNNFHDNVFTLKYDDFVQYPLVIVTKIMDFICNSPSQIPAAVIQQAVTTFQISHKNSLNSSLYKELYRKINQEESNLSEDVHETYRV